MEKIINLSPDVLEHSDSIEKKIINERLSGGPKRTRIIIKNSESGEILGEYENKIVITGSIFSAMKAFGIESPVTLPNYNEELGLDNTLDYAVAEKKNELVEETMQMMKQEDSDISVFDMLLNMKNRDDSVYAHCIDVALISNILSKWLHFSEEDQRMATACGLFHDVGKFLLPSGVLRKPGKLTPDEFSIIKTHTIEGFHLLNRYENIPLPVKNAALMMYSPFLEESEDNR